MVQEMKIGDVVINPYVSEYLANGKIHPMYKNLVINVGSRYTTCLLIDGKQSRYYTHDVKEWKVAKHIDLTDMIY